MSQRWIHSDWHWMHENIYKFETFPGGPRVRAKFENATEGDAYMRDRYMSLVKPSDKVTFLGDLTMHRGKKYVVEFIDYFRTLPGEKDLILGNHDHYDVGVYKEAGFRVIRASNMLDGILFTHYPVHQDSIGFRAIGNAHGHIHEKPSPTGLYYNCCVEVNHYEPIPIENIKAALKSLSVKLPTSDVNGVPMFEP